MLNTVLVKKCVSKCCQWELIKDFLILLTFNSSNQELRNTITLSTAKKSLAIDYLELLLKVKKVFRMRGKIGWRPK